MTLAITGNLVLSQAATDEAHPNAPVFGYQNLLAEGELTASSETADGYAENALIGTTDFWTPETVPATLEVQLPAVRAADYAGIEAHTLGDAECSVYIEYHDGNDWVTAASGSTGDNRGLAFLFDEQSSDRWRLRVEGSAPPSIGVVHIGKALRGQRRLYQGHTPIRFGETVRLLVNESETGQLIGNSVIRYGAGTTIELDNLTPDWVRGPLEPFRKHFNQGLPFFWLWRPGKYPDEVAYCWRQGGELQ
ncbi:hypothetical protein CAI21_21965, partial [Alkalilimnicola ehrlichii]